MGIISRGSKSAGGTEFTTGLIIDSEVDTDFNNLYNEINGGLDNDNIDASAGIALTKIDDTSVNLAAAVAVASSGTPDATSLATTAAGEIHRLRYMAGLIGIGSTGLDVDRNNGSAQDVPWYVKPARGGSYVRNGSFETQTGGAGSAPDGWTLAGTPATAALIATDVTNGDGMALRIVADAADEGVTQTLAGLPASSQFLVTARIKVAVGTVRLVITGADAASEFRSVDISSTSISAATIAAIVATDSTPTAIVVKFLSAANLDDFQVDDVNLFLTTNRVTSRPGYHSVSDFSTTVGDHSTTRIGFPDGDALTAAMTVPGPGYSLRVTAFLSFSDVAAAAKSIAYAIVENSGAPSDVAIVADYVAASQGSTVTCHYVNTTPTVGATYTYTVEADASGACKSNGTVNGMTLGSRLTVELIPPG